MLDYSLTELDKDEVDIFNSPDRFNRKMHHRHLNLSMNVSIVIKYDYLDLDLTPYNFNQEFTHRDTMEYFRMMKEISSNTINNLIDNSRKYHFYRSPFTGKVKEEIKKIMPDADEGLIVYHFGLYECESHNACRETGERSPRVYFILGSNGFIYIVFFDPYHELNPMVIR